MCSSSSAVSSRIASTIFLTSLVCALRRTPSRTSRWRLQQWYLSGNNNNAARQHFYEQKSCLLSWNLSLRAIAKQSRNKSEELDCFAAGAPRNDEVNFLCERKLKRKRGARPRFPGTSTISPLAPALGRNLNSSPGIGH
jgi:hypothetical protein